MSYPNRPINILSKYISSQPIGRIIRHLHNLSFVFELDDSSYRTKNFFLDNLHIRMNVREYGRLDKVSFVPVTFTTVVDSGTCLFSGVNVSHHALIRRELNESTVHRTRTYVELDFRYLWAMFSSLSKWITGVRGKAFSSSSELFQELIVDALLYKNTRTSYTRLTFIITEYYVGPERQLIEYAPMLALNLKIQCPVGMYTLKDIQDSNGSPFDSLIKVSIIKYHTRTLSSQFQCYDL